MSTSEELLRVKLLDARKSEAELRAIRKELEGVSGATEKHGRAAIVASRQHEHGIHALRRTTGALGYAGGLIGLAGVGYGLKDIFQGGIQAQEQTALLGQALKTTGQGGAAHMAELEKAITRTTSRGGFGALEETEGLSSFVRETGSATKAVKLNSEAIALARGAHMDYGRALMVVRRIQTGQVGRLQQYLGIIQPVKYNVQQLTAVEKKRDPALVKRAELLDKEATAQEANRRVLERYGGAVETYNKTAAGSINNANNAFKRATEELGEKTLPVITEVAKGFSEIITEAEAGKGIWGTVGRDISGVAHDLKDTWEWFERNKGVAEALGGVLLTVFGTEKILKFYSALKKLEIVQLLASLFGKLASAEKSAAEAQLAFDLAGGGGAAGGLSKLLKGGGLARLLRGGGLVAGAAALDFGLTEGAHELLGTPKASKILHTAFDPFHASRREEEGNKPWLHGVRRPRSPAAERAYIHQGEVETSPTSGLRFNASGQPITEHVTIKADVHLDGKQIAEAVGHHVRTRPTLQRPFAEGVTAYAQHKAARE
jgi:hypothetical protein